MSKCFYDELLDSIFVNKRFPYYSAERRLDPIFLMFVANILSCYKDRNIEVVLPEFPIKTNNNQAKCIDYLCKYSDENKIIYLEFKTDRLSFNDNQLRFYENNLDWKVVIDNLKVKIKKCKVSDYKVKYFYLLKVLIDKKLISCINIDLNTSIANIENLVAKRNLSLQEKRQRTILIHRLLDSVIAIPHDVEIIYLCPSDDKIEAVLENRVAQCITFSDLKNMNFDTDYKYEWNKLVRLIETI